MKDTQRVYTNAPWESKIGYCRAIRVGNNIYITGTAPVDDNGNTAHVGNAYLQTCRCFEIIQKTLESFGSGLHDIVRTRMFVTDIMFWPEYGKAHSEFMGKHPPATTMVEVKSLIDKNMLIEIEADSIIREKPN